MVTFGQLLPYRLLIPTAAIWLIAASIEKSRILAICKDGFFNADKGRLL